MVQRAAVPGQGWCQTASLVLKQLVLELAAVGASVVITVPQGRDVGQPACCEPGEGCRGCAANFPACRSQTALGKQIPPVWLGHLTACWQEGVGTCSSI